MFHQVSIYTVIPSSPPGVRSQSSAFCYAEKFGAGIASGASDNSPRLPGLPKQQLSLSPSLPETWRGHGREKCCCTSSHLSNLLCLMLPWYHNPDLVTSQHCLHSLQIHTKITDSKLACSNRECAKR